MEVIPEGFEKILIGNIRGLTGTIEPGTITMTEPDTDPTVTNSGTDTEAVFDFEIPRFDVTGQTLYDSAVEDGFTGSYDDWQHEYLGGLISPEMPWVTGYFQDRSVPLNTAVYPTPVFVDGKASLISGNNFIADSEGVWVLNVGGGLSVTSILGSGKWIGVFVLKNGATVGRVFLSASIADIPSISCVNRAVAGDVFAYYLYATSSYPDISNIPFCFAKLS